MVVACLGCVLLRTTMYFEHLAYFKVNLLLMYHGNDSFFFLCTMVKRCFVLYMYNHYHGNTLVFWTFAMF